MTAKATDLMDEGVRRRENEERSNIRYAKEEKGRHFSGTADCVPASVHTGNGRQAGLCRGSYRSDYC